MDFELGDEQELIVGTIRRFADKKLASWAADADRDGRPPERLLDVAAELGLLIDAVPESAGGLLDGEFDHVTRSLRGLELAEACPALAAVLETNVEPALAATRWASDDIAADLFASLADGGLATTVHDWRGRLRVTERGDDLVVHGNLGPVPVLAGASHALLVARNQDDDGNPTQPIILLIPTSAAEVTPCVPSGWRASLWGTLSCAGTVVPAERILCRGANAVAARSEILAWYRLNLAARAVGSSTAALRNARAYAADRVQFGQPIGTFQSLARLQDMHETRTEAARLMVLHAAWQLGRRGPDIAADACSRARDFAAETVKTAAIDALQIYGGYGFVNDYPAEKSMRDARAFEILSGVESFERVLAAGPAPATTA